MLSFFFIFISKSIFIFVMVFFHSCTIALHAVTACHLINLRVGLWAENLLGLYVCVMSFSVGARFRVGVLNWSSLFLPTQNQWSVKKAWDD